MRLDHRTCATCAWRLSATHGSTCEARAIADEPGPVVHEDTPACPAYEPAQRVGCDDCGACCREAFDSVPVEPEDVERLGPALAHRVRVHDDGWTDLHRVPSASGCGTRCIALQQEAHTGVYRCDMYAVRPQTCRDVGVGTRACHFARCRVGLSRGA